MPQRRNQPMHAVSKFLLAQEKTQGVKTSLRTAQVTALNVDGTVNLVMQGSALSNVPYLVGFLPVVGDIVWCLVQPGIIGVLGRKARDPNDTGGSPTSETDAVWLYSEGNGNADPGAGYFNVQGSGNQPRQFAFSKTDADGVQRNLLPLSVGDTFILTDDPASPPITGFARHLITTEPVDHGTWVHFETLRTDTTGTGQSPPTGTRVRFIAYLQAPPTSTEPGSPLGSSYTWSDLTAITDPGNGMMRGNAAELVSVTQMAFSKVDRTGAVVEGFGIYPGDVLYLSNDARTWGSLMTVTTIQAFGTWFSVGVEFNRGQSANPPEGESVLTQWFPQTSSGAPPEHEHPKYLEPDEVLGGEGIDVDRGTYPGSVLINATGDSGSAKAKYKFMHKTSGVAAPGELYFTDSLPANAGEVVFAQVDDIGDDYEWALGAIRTGDEFTIVDTVGQSFYRGWFTAPGTDNGGAGYWTFPCAVIAVDGAKPADGTRVDVSVHLGTSEGLDHGTLQGLGDDDHPQYAKITDPGLTEVFVQPAPPVAPDKPSVWVDSDGTTGIAPIVSAIPVGGVIPFGGGSPPAEWLLCDGRAVSRTQYAVLYSVIGTTFGAGDGTTTFNVPDLNQRFVRGGTSAGGVGGTASHSHPGTNWRTGNTSVGGTNNADAAPNGTGATNSAPDGTGSSGNHDHGTDAVSDHSHGIGSDGGHNHSGRTGFQSGTFGSSGGGTGVTKTHGHDISSGGNHNHGGTGSNGGHGHGRTGTTGSHSHSVPNSNHSHSVPGSNHSHGIAGANHDHNVPTSTVETNLPPYMNMLMIIYSGVA